MKLLLLIWKNKLIELNMNKDIKNFINFIINKGYNI